MVIGTQVTRKSIERALYKRLGDVLEANNHYPQKIGKSEAQFDAALATLRANPNNLIIGTEGVSSGFNKEANFNNRILIYRTTSANGGHSQYVEWIEENPKVNQSDPTLFTKYRQDGPVTDLEYEMRYIAEEVKYDREMERMLLVAFRKQIYIPSLNDDGTEGQRFYMQFRNEINLSVDGYIERAYRFVVRDIVLVVPDVVRENIKPATITFDVGIKED